jgi:hypothetical protein
LTGLLAIDRDRFHVYTENDSKVGNLARRLRKFFVWSERPLCKHKARDSVSAMMSRSEPTAWLASDLEVKRDAARELVELKTKNVLHRQRRQKSTFESFSV